MRDRRGKKIINMVCDKCAGLLFESIDGEIQLEHEKRCPNKCREDTFLISLIKATSPQTGLQYPSNAKLNPIIHQKLWDGEITQEQARYMNEALHLGDKA